MSYQVLARKYRPQNFSDVRGQEHITQTLQNAIKAGRVHHAYLFTGVRGVGKTTVARIFAKALNCEKAPATEPCNKCDFCSEITSGNHLDVQEIDGASNTGVDDVREIRERIKYLPSKGKYKIYIIDEVHMLSTAAFNALLKTLEEPPKHAIFIFATTEPEKIPPTILSRCQRYDFRRIPVPTIVEMIKEIAETENVSIEPDAIIAIANEAEGSARDSQSLFDQAVAYSGKDVTYEKLKGMLGFMDRSQLRGLLLNIVEKNISEALKVVDDVFNQGGNLVRLSYEMLNWFRGLLVLRATGEQSFLGNMPAEDREFINMLSEKRGLTEWEQMFRVCYRQSEEIAKSKYPKMLFESLVISLSQVGPVRSVDELIEKIDKLMQGDISNQSKFKKGLSEPMERPLAKPAPGPGSGKNGKPSHIPNPAARGSMEEKEWNSFLKWLHSEKPQLSSILEHGIFVSGGNGSVHLQYSAGSIYGEMLKEDYRKKQLEEQIEKHFGKRYLIEFKFIDQGISTQELKQEKIKENRERTRRLKEEAMENEIVKDAISILNADVREIKIKAEKS